jgi:predicted DNA-binding protein (MmcQ/YjbR family)
MASVLDRVRKICLALPEAHEVEAWGEPTFRVKNKLFAMYAAEGNHHGAGRAGVWIKSTHVNQDLMIQSDRERFFSPPYVGPSGWIGVFLDNKPDWDVVAEIVRDGYLLTAPKKIAASLDASPANKKAAKPAARKKSPAKKTVRKSR